ncbi:MAG: hypothetical protein FWG25_05340 [Promicromonosporaceae bacterium]|nr:hypothetical protein [Promicromonosporaceae bacterium]
MAVSSEQYAFALKQTTTYAQLRFAWWLRWFPDATKAEALETAERLISQFGPVAARFACTYYMSQRGIDDGWQILPSGGLRPETVRRWMQRDYDDAEPNRGLRGVIDQAVKAYASRTISRGRGYERNARPSAA